MIPVRVPADLKVHVVRTFDPPSADHFLYEEDCPACDEPLRGHRMALVAVGIPPDEQKPAGWTTGGGVAVHAKCAGAS